MQKGWAILFLALLTATCPAQQALPSWDGNASKAWWAQNPTPDLWPKAAEALQAQLEAAYKRNGTSVYSQSDFQNWLDLLEWVRIGLDSPDLLASGDNLKTFQALGQDDVVSHLFVEKLSPLDDKKQALALLLKLAQAQPDDLHEYAALGVAYCLVFDQPFPADWPHPQVQPSAVPIGDLDVVTRFNYYVQANRNKKTDLDLTEVPFEDLKFLVASEVKLSEFDYAQTTERHIPYDDFAQAFSSINYVDDRANNEIYDWPWPSYTLADIEKKGGICIDQAYYAETLGKGRGIPTIRFTGMGNMGYHAWFGYLNHEKQWVLDCGRYANQNYLKGFAVDPQTWQQVKDTTIENLVKNGPRDPNYQPAKTALAWARLHASQPNYQQLLDEARAIMPELAETWQTEADLMDKSTTIDLQDKKTFYKAWITQFQNDADLKVDGQTRFLALLKQANDPDADGLQQDIILQNRSSGADLSIKGSFSAISDKIQAQDWDGAKLAFEVAERDFNDKDGTTFFNDVLVPYVQACVQHAQFKQAEDGLQFVEDRMPMVKQLGLLFGHLKEETTTLEKEVPEMTKWLGEIDEGNYEQAWNDGGKTLQGKRDLTKWTDYLNHVRQPLGKCTSRDFVSGPDVTSELVSSDGNTTKGTFIFTRYHSVFETQPHVAETLIFEKEGDDWRPMEYEINPQATAAENP